MAESVKKIIEIDVDLSGADGGLAQLKLALLRTQEQASALKKEIKDNAKAGEEGKQANIALAKTLVSLENEQKQLREQLRLTSAQHFAQVGSIKAIEAETNRLTAQAKKLNPEIASEAALRDELTAKIFANNEQLKSYDATQNRHQRNVGNYASSYNGLAMSINQLSREMPNFAMNMNTGFLAISNNIPMLVDQIDILKQRNKELIAQGEPAVSIFSQLGKAILSWNTLISVGVSLLTVYGGKMVEWIGSLFTAEEAQVSLNEALEDNLEIQTKVNEARLGGMQGTQKGIDVEIDKQAVLNRKLVEQQHIYNDLSLEEDKRKAALNEIGNIQAQIVAADFEILKAREAFAISTGKNDLERAKLKKDFYDSEVKLAVMATDLWGEEDEKQKAIHEWLNKQKSVADKEYSDILKAKKDKEDEEAKQRRDKALKDEEDFNKKVFYLGDQIHLYGVEQQKKRDAARKRDEKEEIKYYEWAHEEKKKQIAKDLKDQEDMMQVLLDMEKDKEDKLKELRKQWHDVKINGEKEVADALGQIANNYVNSRVEAELQASSVEIDILKNKLDKKEISEDEYRNSIASIKADDWKRQHTADMQRVLINGIVAASKTIAQLGFANPAVGPALAALGIEIGLEEAVLASQKVPKFAKGTRYAPGGMAWVGEEGAELIDLPKGSRVFTASQSSSMMANYTSPSMTAFNSQSTFDYEAMAGAVSQSLRGASFGVSVYEINKAQDSVSVYDNKFKR